MSRGHWVQGYFPVFTVGDNLTVLLAALTVIITSFTVILAFTFTVIRAAGAVAGAVAVTAIVVTVAAVRITVAAVVIAVIVPLIPIIAARRILTATTAAGGGRTTTTRGGAVTAAVTTSITASITAWLTARVKAPRGRRGSAGPLDFQQIIATDTLVMHFMVGIISITAAFVLNKREQPARRGARSRNITANKTPIAISNISLTQLQMSKLGENYDE
jgi:hypothetical protein